MYASGCSMLCQPWRADGLFEEALAIPGVERWPFDLARFNSSTANAAARPGHYRIAAAYAIQAAIHRGRDYAAALGTLDHVEHIADAGLLGGDSAAYEPPHRTLRAVSASADGPGTPALNPVPQELIATIDARFRTTAVSLPGT